MRSDVLAADRELRPEPRVRSRCKQVEPKDGQGGQEPLHERLALRPLLGGHRAVHAVEKLGGGDRGDRDRLVFRQRLQNLGPGNRPNRTVLSTDRACALSLASTDLP